MAKAPALIERSKESGGAVTIRPPGLTIIRRMSAGGFSQATIAKKLGIDRKTFAKLREEDEAVTEAFELGNGKLSDEITSLLLKNARRGNIAAQIFLAKALLYWSDRHDGIPEAKRPNINIILPSAMTPEQWEKMTQDAKPALEIEHEPDVIERFERGRVIR